jgi:hypothetical protein
MQSRSSLHSADDVCRIVRQLPTRASGGETCEDGDGDEGSGRECDEGEAQVRVFRSAIWAMSQSSARVLAGELSEAGRWRHEGKDVSLESGPFHSLLLEL